MKPLTAKQAAEWCRNLGVPAEPSSGPSREILADHFGLPEDSTGRVAVAAERLAQFDGASRILIWITGWGVWPSVDRSDDFREIRAELGEPRWLDEIPAHLASKADFDYLCRMVKCAVSSLWDLYLVGPKGRKILHFSHDEWGGSRGIPTMPNKAQHPTA
ncbi:hypothetical protein HAHE_24600 [Haloferula helveola]|uniref:Uncharacterized protein n=1 Tax=Haloferula helveola TaxID=490095 RepID=A0ABM7RFP2_9BACT|nr:hypothetical protein HAHE_24600 [Haloferula helveola]